MNILKSNFIDLANNLIGNIFSDFAKTATVIQSTGFNYATQALTTRSETLPMIRIDYKDSQFNGQDIKLGDYVLIGEYAKLTWMPSVDNSTVSFDGVSLNIISIETDPANAVIKLQVRRA